MRSKITMPVGLPSTPLTPVPGSALLLVMTVGYGLLSHLGERLIIVEGISVFWPASGFAAVMLLWAQTPRRRGLVMLGIVLGSALNAAWRGALFPNELGYLLGNLVEPLVVLPFLIRGTSASQRLDRPAGLAWLLGGSALAVSVAATVVTLMGSWAYADAGPTASWNSMWISWALGDLIGLLVVTPLMLQSVPVSNVWSQGSVRQQTLLWALLIVSAVISSLTQEWIIAFLVVIVLIALLLDTAASSVALLFFVAVVLWLLQNGGWQPRPVHGEIDPRLMLIGAVVLVQAVALSTSQRRRAMAGQLAALGQMHRARDTLTAVLEATPNGIAMYRVESRPHGPRFAMTYMNRHGLHQGDVDPAWIERGHYVDGEPDSGLSDLYQHMVRAWTEQEPQELVINYTLSQSRWQGIFTVSVSPVPQDRLVVVWNDITEIAQARDEAHDNWTLLRKALDSGLDAYYILELEDEEWRVVFVNNAGAAHTGLTSEQLVGKQLQKVVPYDIQPLLRGLIDTAIHSQRPQNTLIDLRRFEHGWRGEFDVMVTPAGPKRIVLTLRDASEMQTTRRALEAARSEAVEASLRDPLTGLPNRTVLAQRLTASLDAAESTDDLVAVAFLDIDAFKGINDMYGHAVGDDVLTALASRLRTFTRRNDLAARLGGDEFVVVFTGIGRAWSSEQFETRLRSALQFDVSTGQTRLTVTVSAGLAVGGPDITANDLLENADSAMYISKASRQGRLVAYHPDMKRPDDGRL